jgi:hypothetical protein
LSKQELAYVSTAIAELLLARIRLCVCPIATILTDLQQQKLATVAPAKEVDVLCMSWAIRAVAARVPWRSDCLVQAIAAHRWLRRAGYPTEFFLGVANDNGPFGAHAWLKCDGRLVTGGTGIGFDTLIEPRT